MGERLSEMDHFESHPDAALVRDSRFPCKKASRDLADMLYSRHMIIPTNMGCRFAGVLFPVIAFATSPVWAGAVYTIQDGGVPRQFEVADDEVSLVRKDRGLADDAKASLTDAVLVKDYGRRVVMRFPQVEWKKAVGPRSVGGAEFEPVAYEQGAARNDVSRRILTPQVLASGGDEAELLRVSGALGAKATTVAGYTLLTFPSAAEALTGTEKLRKAGLSADPLLRKQSTKRAVPNDADFGEQWYLQNTGQGNGVPGTDINSILAWDFYTGSGVTIAIVDDGLDLTHVDLVANVLPLGAGGPHHDFNGNDDDPSPEVGDAHGTAVAGLAAARGGNNQGISGSGPQASLLGLRLTSAGHTDAEEQSALSWDGGGVPTTIDISVNGWGPAPLDLGGPGVLALDALSTSTTTGRAGKGVIFCWAAGDGGTFGDNVNLDGYANSRFVIAVGAIGNNGKQANYSESGSSLLVSAPSAGGLLNVYTTDVTGGGGYNGFFSFGEPADLDYTNSFGGTSASAPLVAGVASLMLEANSTLGYRDVMEIIASTAAKVDATNPGWASNGAGFLFNHGYGAGMVDATAAVIRAEDWTNLGPEVVQERILGSPAVPIAIPDGSVNGINRDFNFTGGTGLRVEHVEVQLDIAHSHRSDLEITLKSPSGHVSRLIERRARPTGNASDVNYTDGNLGWTFTTTQHWGEDSVGTWTLNINDATAGTAGSLRKARMRIFGTDAPSSRFTFEKKQETVSEVSPEIVITVRRRGSVAGPATVDYYTSDKSSAKAATPGVSPPDGNFLPVLGTISFADGEDSKTFSVPIYNDTQLQPNERVFYAVLRNPSVGTLGGITVESIDIDDDEGNAVTVKATDQTASERNLATEPADHGTFTISRKTATPAAVTVHYTLTQPPAPGAPVQEGAPSYATHILDYAELPLSAVIPANGTSVDVVIVPRNDRTPEGTEVVEMVLTPDQNYKLGLPNKASINLVDNDLVPVSVSASVSSVVESSNTEIVFTITRDTSVSQLSSPLNVSLEASGTARPQIDYDPPFPAFITIAPGQATATVSIRPNDNSAFNPTKTVVLGVSQGAEYKEGFFRSVEVRILDDEPVPDGVKPKITISTPSKGQRVDFPAGVTATGTATDNPDGAGKTNVAQVQFRLNQGAWNVATLTNNDWSADITMHSAFGDNVLDAFSIDEAGNESAISSVKFTYVKLRNLTTTVVGPGSLPADFTGVKPLEVGQSYTIVAKPSSSANLFDGWSGAFTATSKVLSFTMPDEDIALTATFSAVLISDAVAGKYAGLVSRESFKARSDSSFNNATSGYLEAAVSKTGKFSGKLIYGGVRYSLHGDFTASGAYLGEVPRKKNTPLQLSLSLDTDPSGSKTLTGIVSADGVDSETVCPKLLTKGEAPAVTTGLVGKFTFQMPMEDLLTPSKPQGTGVGTMTLDAKGNVRWKGTLPDGTPASQSAYLSKDKTWPLFVSLYNGRGVVLGTMIHDGTQSQSDLSGRFNWDKVGDPRDKTFPNGFTVFGSQLLGSAYVVPAPGQRVLSGFVSSNATLNLDGGNFQTPFPAKTMGITDRNKVTISPVGADLLALSVTTSTGALSGTFIHPVTGAKTKIAGVVLQKTQRGAGVFIGSTRSNTAIQTGRLSFSLMAN